MSQRKFLIFYQHVFAFHPLPKPAPNPIKKDPMKKDKVRNNHIHETDGIFSICLSPPTERVCALWAVAFTVSVLSDAVFFSPLPLAISDRLVIFGGQYF